jgi:nucleotide-binding universal stress UspA family protein
VSTPFTEGLQRILVATDLTSRSTAAVQRAASLAHLTGARLTLLHVIDPRQPERVARMQANRAYIELLAQADRAFGSSAGFIDVAVRRGEPRDIIARTAREWDADLIVMAAPQPRRLDAIVGTTAERLIRSTRRPVLVVHREMRGPYQTVAIATDLSDASLPMMQTAVRLGALDRASAAVVHAIHPSYDGMMRSAGLDESTVGLYQQGSREGATQRLQDMIVAAGLRPESTRAIVRNDPPATAIRNVLETQQQELLAIGASRWFLLKRLLIGSVADRLLREASCDVLVVPLRRVAVRSNVASLPRPVPVQSGLHQHDRADRRANAHE